MIKYDDLIGAPFKNNGRDIKTGVDCYGLAMEVYSRFGIKLPEFFADYNDSDKISNIIHGQMDSSVWREVKPPYPVPSLLAIRFGVPSPIINHTGVYIGNSRFIHIREKTGVCIENIHSIAWRHVIAGFFIYKGQL
ncbi:glycoside hydrolase [Pectinatus frisingensis]|uniref:glycoside hydrolase n=1 Tax=Pectinatus frisingensis TaxID=865 RepID=UPI0018C5BA3D|nr:glycoside hydrolase [Pectinatus frisingensis]